MWQTCVMPCHSPFSSVIFRRRGWFCIAFSVGRSLSTLDDLRWAMGVGSHCQFMANERPVLFSLCVPLRNGQEELNELAFFCLAASPDHSAVHGDPGEPSLHSRIGSSHIGCFSAILCAAGLKIQLCLGVFHFLKKQTKQDS